MSLCNTIQGGEAETNGSEGNGAGNGETANGGQEEQRGEHAEYEAVQANAGGEPNREEIAAL
ncbi:hypothetical protein OCS_06179 [Ophiocordyceps sinensis CO18]|uniref:Uncharacterized protein n=1 Tax=Ophiocordyceps sinensis (strain Co18 / CGMCC 3.14243) TaxID=911162 RepID=T5A8G6_OPHSC|nr:hypothetical protein OCS_06179 [Ophiocordyceps sinensis CO18]